MFSSLIRSQDASPGIPARWMTASAPWQAAVMASRSVTDAWMTSSPGSAVIGAMSSTRSVRPGLASLGRSMEPTRPAAPVMTKTDIPRLSLYPSTVTDGHQVTYAPFLSAGPDRKLGNLMGLTRGAPMRDTRARGALAPGALTLPRMGAHRLVIVAAALTVAVAAALATALATFGSQALPRAVRHDLGHAAGTSMVIRGNVNASQGAQYTSLLPGKIAAALDGTPFACYNAYWSDPLGFVPGSHPVPPSGSRTVQIAAAAALDDITARAELVAGHWPGALPGHGGPIPAALPASAAALLHVATGDVLQLRDRISGQRIRFVVTGLYRPRQVTATYWSLDDVSLGGQSTLSGFTTYGPLTVPAAAFRGPLAVDAGSWLAVPQTASVPAGQLRTVAANVTALRQGLAEAVQLPDLATDTGL